jgi:hypothetical protein
MGKHLVDLFVASVASVKIIDSGGEFFLPDGFPLRPPSGDESRPF